MLSPGLRVLVAEDETLVSLMLEDALTRLGCAVVGPAARLAEAGALAAREEIDAALLDINLHGQTVYPVAETLARRGVPFVFVTGYERSQIAEAFRDRPVLRKPFTQAGIRKALTSLIEHRQPAAP